MKAMIFRTPALIRPPKPALATAAPTRPPTNACDETTESVIPGDDVPDDRPDQRAENDVVIDNGWINGALADGGRHLQLEQEIGKKIEGSAQTTACWGLRTRVETMVAISWLHRESRS